MIEAAIRYIPNSNIFYALDIIHDRDDCRTVESAIKNHHGYPEYARKENLDDNRIRQYVVGWFYEEAIAATKEMGLERCGTGFDPATDEVIDLYKQTHLPISKLFEQED